MGYTNSPMVAYTRLSPNHSGQRTHSIDRITPHSVVGQCSVEVLGDVFYPFSRQASSNYGIGVDGRVGLYVEEKNRSWCSSSNANDQRAVTIECASDTAEPYAFKDTVYQTLIRLCADICRRNGKTRLLWLGDKDKTLGYEPKPGEMVLTAHRWFSNTSCPGDWMMARMGDLAEKVTAILTPLTPDTPLTQIIPPTPPTSPKTTYYRVRKSWEDKASQIAAYTILANAKLCVDANPGYSAYDESGNKVWPEETPPFTRYNLTEEQLVRIARLCQQEQGTVAGAKAEASLMANQLETSKARQQKYGTGADGLYNWVCNGGWFSRAEHWMDVGSVTDAVLAGVRDVLVNGNRTLPQFIDEHDCFSDLVSISTGDVKDRSAYIQGKTVIKNRFGSTYTFWCFPDSHSDPFGFTEAAYQAVNGKSTVVPFKVRVSADDLQVRTGPGIDCPVTGRYTGKGTFTIVEVASGKGSDAGWGRLKSGAGWISLDHTIRV